MVLRLYGVENLQHYVRNHIKLAKQFEELVAQDPRFEVIIFSMYNFIYNNMLVIGILVLDTLFVSTSTVKANDPRTPRLIGDAKVSYYQTISSKRKNCRLFFGF